MIQARISQTHFDNLFVHVRYFRGILNYIEISNILYSLS